MSQKKSRRAPAQNAASTAVVAAPDVVGISSTPPPPTTPVPETRPTPAPAEDTSFVSTPIGRISYRIFRIFSSLQLAICLLSFFTLCLIEATILESRHDAAVAKQLIYGTWWFTLLLFVLGTNIVGAALKKMDPKKLNRLEWPWKKHQTGFLVTHVGLITLVFGGLLKTIGGEEGQIHLVDAASEEIEKAVHRPNKSNVLYLVDEHRIVVKKVTGSHARKTDTSAPQQWVHSISPGSFPWHEGKEYKSNMTGELTALRAIASPFGRRATYRMDDARMIVHNYLPNVELWPYSETGGSDKGFPAVELRADPKEGDSKEFWVTGFAAELKGAVDAQTEASFEYLTRLANNFRGDRAAMSGGAPGHVLFDFLTALDEDQVKEFLSPPAPSEMGSRGRLVLFVGPQKRAFRIDLASDSKGKTVPLGDTGLEFEATGFGDVLDEMEVPEPTEKAQREALRKFLPEVKKLAGRFPYVRFRLHRGEQFGEFVACPRLPNLPLFQGKGRLLTEVSAFMHHPDGTYDRSELQAAVEFLHGPDGRTYFRSFSSGGAATGPGEPIDLSDGGDVVVLPLREIHRTRMQSIGWLPRAKPQTSYKPRNLVRIGAKPPLNYGPALIGVIQDEGKEFPFQVAMRQEQPTVVPVGEGGYVVTYRQAVRDLDFNIKLLRVYDAKDPGTERSAKYHSDIVISYKKDGKEVEDKYEGENGLYMNHTIDFGGYRLFQANFEPTRQNYDDPRMKMIRRANISGITLSRDPGTVFYYIGLLTVVAGIFIMFYMKAYFFKRAG